MTYLEAIVLTVGLLCLLNLLLTFGVIRRLRQHTEHLNRLAPADSPPGIGVGDAVGDFETTTTTGEPLSRAALTGQTLVGFFSPGCQPCATQLPHFIDRARELPGGRAQALAVVVAGTEGGQDYVERLAPVARVVTEGVDGALQAAFQVTGFPMLYLVDDGTVRAAGVTVADLATAGTPATV